MTSFLSFSPLLHYGVTHTIWLHTWMQTPSHSPIWARHLSTGSSCLRRLWIQPSRKPLSSVNFNFLVKKRKREGSPSDTDYPELGPVGVTSIFCSSRIRSFIVRQHRSPLLLTAVASYPNSIRKVPFTLQPPPAPPDYILWSQLPLWTLFPFRFSKSTVPSMNLCKLVGFMAKSTLESEGS